METIETIGIIAWALAVIFIIIAMTRKHLPHVLLKDYDWWTNEHDEYPNMKDIKEKIIAYGELTKEYGYDEGMNHIIYPEQLKEIDKALEAIIKSIVKT